MMWSDSDTMAMPQEKMPSLGCIIVHIYPNRTQYPSMMGYIPEAAAADQGHVPWNTFQFRGTHTHTKSTSHQKKHFTTQHTRRITTLRFHPKYHILVQWFHPKINESFVLRPGTVAIEYMLSILHGARWFLDNSDESLWYTLLDRCGRVVSVSHIYCCTELLQPVTVPVYVFVFLCIHFIYHCTFQWICFKFYVFENLTRHMVPILQPVDRLNQCR